jgi:hypothetical protein
MTVLVAKRRRASDGLDPDWRGRVRPFWVTQEDELASDDRMSREERERPLTSHPDIFSGDQVNATGV